MAQRLNRDEFTEKTAVHGRLALIEFYSDSCIPCKRLSPLLAEIEEANPDLFVGKVNVTCEKELTQELGVTATPTLLFYLNGEEQARLHGSIRKRELEEQIGALR